MHIVHVLMLQLLVMLLAMVWQPWMLSRIL
jgi:hypothetical protein